MADAWKWLPSNVFSEVLRSLRSLDVKTLRLVCQGWKVAVDETQPWLKPRALKVDRLLQVFPGITSLDCSSVVGPSIEQLAQIASLTRLRRLVVRGNYTTGNNALSAVASITGLTELLFVEAKAVVDSDIEVLSQLTGLAKLSLKGADGVRGSGLSFLRYCTELKELDVRSCCNFSYEGVACLADLTWLTRLELAGCKLVQEEDVTFMAVVTEDTLLRKQALIKLLTQLTGLQHLNLNNCGCLTEEWLAPHFSNLQNIEELDIGGRSLSHDVGVETIAGLTTLRELSLEGLGPLLGKTILKLKKLTRLRKLNLSITQLKDKHLLAITRLHSLESLTFSNARRITNEAMKAIGRRMSNLSELRFSNSQVSLDGLQTFPLHQSLCSLSMTDSDRVSDRMGTFLGQLTRLSSLDVSLSRFVSGEMASNLQCLPDLRVLDLSCCEGVNDRSITQLSTLTGLMHLGLSHNQVGDVGVVSIQPLTRLTFLGLGQTNVSDIGLPSVQGLVHLEELELFSTMITDAGLHMLSRMTALRTLHLGFCKEITDTGVREHLRPLAHNHSLAVVTMWRAPNVTEDARAHLPYCTIKGSLMPSKVPLKGRGRGSN